MALGLRFGEAEVQTRAAGETNTPQVGETLSAVTSGIADADGLEEATFAYQWIRAETDIAGATGPSYTLADADEGERSRSGRASATPETTRA